MGNLFMSGLTGNPHPRGFATIEDHIIRLDMHCYQISQSIQYVSNRRCTLRSHSMGVQDRLGGVGRATASGAGGRRTYNLAIHFIYQTILA